MEVVFEQHGIGGRDGRHAVAGREGACVHRAFHAREFWDRNDNILLLQNIKNIIQNIKNII